MIQNIDDSITLCKYKDIMQRLVKMYYPNAKDIDINNALDYSIHKRYKRYDATLYNNYTERHSDLSLLQLTDYIYQREPIVTAYGTLFKKHGETPNPLCHVIQSFLDKRDEDKALMFKYPKGSEDYEKYNLLQSLNI